ncbi:MAG: 2Fe-2S iron-sulfur cluster-binding protein [Chitinophagales bacterium]|jgi:NADH-quinone oxidoreductase subunit G|nr:2Fe-2S iron-sulfur cluster-binding protein [Chitinophagales bacterium]
MSDTLKVTIDGQSIQVPMGTSILEAARMIGGKLVPPAMCYYKPLKGSGGKCRTCLVAVTQGSEKDPRPMPKLVPSCSTSVMDGMVVESAISERVTEARQSVTEFLLINHPLDCPVCDQAGECKLQDLSFEHGKSFTNYKEERRDNEPDDLGDKIKLNVNRCILCYRCVYAAEQLCGTRDHGVLYRGDHAEISTMIEKSLDSDFIGNVIDVCPVGALTDKTFRFRSRIWFTEQWNAHRSCDKCCGKVVLHKIDGQIARVSARKNEWDEVEEWICDTCRFDKKENEDWTIESKRVPKSKSVQTLNKYSDNSQSVYVKVEGLGSERPKELE